MHVLKKSDSARAHAWLLRMIHTICAFTRTALRLHVTTKCCSTDQTVVTYYNVALLGISSIASCPIQEDATYETVVKLNIEGAPQSH